MTGRAAGYCAGYGVPGYMNPYGGRWGAGLGWGRGRFWGARFPGWGWGAPYAGYSPYAYGGFYSAEREKDALQAQVQFFEKQLASMKERIQEIETEGSEKEK